MKVVLSRLRATRERAAAPSVAGAWCAACATVAFLMTGCGGDGGGRAAHVVRDSAGVRIVENGAPAWDDDEAWRLGAAPVLTLGAVDGAVQETFGQPVAVVVQPDGGVLVADRDGGLIRAFDGAGEHVRTGGGQGRGPGEFMALNDLFRVPGDTLVAADFMGRLTLLTGDGAVVRTIETGQPPPTGRLPDGRWFRSLSRAPEGERALGAQRYGNLLVALGEGGAPSDTLAELRGMDALHIEMNFDGRVQIVGQPFPYGRYRLTEVHDGTIWTTDGTTFELTQLNADGGTRALVRRPGQRSPVTAELRQRYADDLLAAAPERALPAVRRRLERVVFPDTIPAWQALQVDAEGHAWARHYELPDDSVAVWSVFAPEGRWLGDVRTPVDLDVMAIGHGRLAGVRPGDMGVPFVHVYRLENHPGSR